MNTIEDQIDSTETTNHWRPVADDSTQAQASNPVVHSYHRATTFPSRPTTSWSHRIACDADSSNLVNFPLAFSAFTLVTIGLITAFWGMAVVSVWLTVVGFLLSLAGSGLYGWSVCDD